MRTRAWMVVGLVSLVALLAPAAQARSADWRGPLFPMDGMAVDFESPIAGSRAAYANGGAAVDFVVRAKGLEEGHGYTVWLMVFNHPEFCLGVDATNGYRCGAQDHFNPAAGFSLMYGTGEWAEGDAVRFKATRQANSVFARPGDVLLGPGLVNPSGAELHFRIRDHGPRQECCAEDQIGTFGGGCTTDSTMFVGDWSNGDYACVDVQATGS